MNYIFYYFVMALCFGLPMLVLAHLIETGIFPIRSYLKNKIKPDYYFCKGNGRYYKMLCYWGYDKQSSLIAEMRDLNSNTNVKVDDWYWERMIKVKNYRAVKLLYGNRNQ